jgi:hypothetical protein
MKNTESGLPDSAPETMPVDLNLINWKRVVKKVKRLRGRIAKAKASGDRQTATFLKQVLAKSSSIKLLKLRNEAIRLQKERRS